MNRVIFVKRMFQITSMPGKYIVIFLFCGIMLNPFISYSSRKTDSLKKVYATANTDTGKISLLNNIALSYYPGDSTPNGLIYSGKALKLARAGKYDVKAAESMYTSGFLYWVMTQFDSATYWMKQAVNYYETQPVSKGAIKAYKAMGDIYRDAAQLQASTDAYTKALDAARSIHDSDQMQNIYYNEALLYDLNDQFDLARQEAQKSVDISLARRAYRSAIKGYNVIGSTYGKQGLSSNAVNAYFQALDIISKYLHDENVTGVIKVNIGNIYEALKDSVNAMKYYRQARDIFKSEDKKVSLAQVLGNMGNVYMDAHDYKTAEQYEIESLNVIRAAGDNYYTALCYTNVAEFYDATKQYDKAKDYYETALQLQVRSVDKEGMSYTLSGLGELYRNEGNYPMALEYALMAYDTAVSIQLMGRVKDEAKILSDIYEKLHQPDKALVYYKQYIKVRDSLDNKEEAKKLISAELTHDFEQKQQAEKMEDEEKQVMADEREKREHLVRNFYLGGLLAVLAFMVVLIRSLLRIRKSRQIITEQKLEVEKQKLIVDEKNKDITDSIKYASRIQHALFTTHEYIEKQVKDHFILFKPRDIVSGDFYWAFNAPSSAGNTFYVAACDCTGHGVPGAFMSLLNISMLNETIIERKITRPDLVLNEIRDNIIKALNPEKSDTESKDGMDCSLCAIDFTNKSMQLACANNPVWIVRGTEFIEIQPDKMPVGIQYGEQKPFALSTFKLKEGDCIYLFTDGFADQFGGPRGKKFKYLQLQELIIANSGKPMAEQKDILEKAFVQWMGNLEQIDDVLVIGIKV